MTSAYHGLPPTPGMLTMFSARGFSNLNFLSTVYDVVADYNSQHAERLTSWLGVCSPIRLHFPENE